MEAKEKASELVDKFMTMNFGLLKEYIPNPKECSKRCALICVDEILNELDHLVIEDLDYHKINIEYWGEVKQEIHKL